MKQVLHLFGASGAGTSTLGRYISETLGYHFMDTDDFYWQDTNPPYTSKEKPSERIRRMKEEIARHDHVVIAGSLVDWGDELIPLFTLAIRVETSTPIRIERIKRREKEKFGSRIEAGGDMYVQHKEFLAWAEAYDDGELDIRSKAMHDAWEKLLTCPLILVDGNAPLQESFYGIKEQYSFI